MKGSRLLRILLLSMNLLLAFALCLSITSPWIDPNTFLIPSFFGLGFLALFIANLLFVLFWLALKPGYVIFGLSALLLSTPMITRHLQLSNKSNESGQFDVLSFNVRLFDLYNWSNNKDTRNNILEYIKSKDAEILCLQEYFRSNDPKYFNKLDTLLEVQKAGNHHEHFTAIMHNGLNKFGIATLSSYPIVYKGLVPLDTAGNNVAIYSDIKIDDDTIRVFNVHLASVHLSALEKDISEHIEKNNQQKQWDDLKLLLRKLAGGYKKRADQSDKIAQYIANSPYPVIVCGDFNDTPCSYSYQTLCSGLEDAFIEEGQGLGSTYIGYYPSLRIDYLLHSPAVGLNQFNTEDIKLSDHRPLFGSFSITK